MKHLGDICAINGAEIEPVDVIVGGSPCQDLSAAGKRAGMLHADKGDSETTRSGLFMEQIRIIKEMRNERTSNDMGRFCAAAARPGGRITMKPILDACCGSRMFWFDKENPNVEFCDKRELSYARGWGRNNSIRHIEIHPDTICDFTDLPFPDNSYKLVVKVTNGIRVDLNMSDRVIPSPSARI